MDFNFDNFLQQIQVVFHIGLQGAKQAVAENPNVLVVRDGIQSQSIFIIFIILFFTMMVYILQSAEHTKKEKKKLEQAIILIKEGHEKAMHGTSFDGMYREIQRPADAPDEEEAEEEPQKHRKKKTVKSKDTKPKTKEKIEKKQKKTAALFGKQKKKEKEEPEQEATQEESSDTSEELGWIPMRGNTDGDSTVVDNDEIDIFANDTSSLPEEEEEEKPKKDFFGMRENLESIGKLVGMMKKKK